MVDTLRSRERAINRTSFGSMLGRTAAVWIDNDGWCCLEDAVSADWIAAATKEARQQTAVGDYEVILDDLESNSSSEGHEVAHDPSVRRLLEAVVTAGAPWIDVSRHPIRTSLRVIVGEDPLGRPPNFHYDRSVVTMVIPLQMPHGPPGGSGELILVPNRRPYRRFATTNVVEKAAMQTGRFRRWFVRHLPERTAVVPLTVGNAYMFWGYRTYHTTLPCPADSVRVTLVVHFGEVHDDNRLLTLSKSIGRSWRLKRDSTIRVQA